MMKVDDVLVIDEVARLQPRRLDLKTVGFQETTGFTSPANVHFKRAINLDDLCIKRQDSTYYLRMTTDAMIGYHILSGDIVIMDTDEAVQDGSIIVAWVEDGLRIRQVKLFDQILELHAANPNYDPIYVHELSDFLYYGVVTFVIHRIWPCSTPT